MTTCGIYELDAKSIQDTFDGKLAGFNSQSIRMSNLSRDCKLFVNGNMIVFPVDEKTGKIDRTRSVMRMTRTGLFIQTSDLSVNIPVVRI